MNETARLAHLPISIFAVVMGLSGLTLVWQKTTGVFNAPVFIWLSLLALTTFCFIAFLLIYGTKWIRHRDAVKAEFNHPVKLSFFPAATISTILIGTALQGIAPHIGAVVWLVGAIGHLSLTIVVINLWIHQEHFQIQHINPAWFIPVVGNILLPVAGVGYGQITLSWLGFSIGVLLWPLLLSIVFYRVFFHQPLPARLLPTLFIMIAPPAVGFIAWIALTGALSPFAQILFFAGLFFTALMVTQAPRFAKLPFFLSFWAYSFPMAAITIATLLYYELTGAMWTLFLSLTLLTMTTLLIIWLASLTLLAAKQGRICVPE